LNGERVIHAPSLPESAACLPSSRPYAELNGKRFERVAWRFDYAEGTQAPPKVEVPPSEPKK
jgi:hypothetical protein